MYIQEYYIGHQQHSDLKFKLRWAISAWAQYNLGCVTIMHMHRSQSGPVHLISTYSWVHFILLRTCE